MTANLFIWAKKFIVMLFLSLCMTFTLESSAICDSSEEKEIKLDGDGFSTQLEIKKEKESKIMPQEIRELESAVKKDPSDLKSRFELGKMYMEKKENELAKEQFEEIIQQTESASAYYYLGQIYEKEGEFEEAERVLIKALNIIGDKDKKIELNKKLTQIDGTIEWVKEQREKNTAESHTLLGKFYSKYNKTRAENEFNKAKEIDAKFILVYPEMGIFYLMWNELDKAEESFKEYMDLEKDDKKQGIVKQYLNAIEMEKNAKGAKELYELGLAYSKLNIDKAIQVFEKLVKEYPKNKDWLYNLGLLYKKKGSEENELDVWEKYLAINPEDEEVYNRVINVKEGYNKYAFKLIWGSNSSADGCFSAPNGIAVDKSGNVYVADGNNSRIQKFSSTGEFITKWGDKGNGDGEFVQPFGIAIDRSGNVYVTDCNTNRIQKFSSTGEFIAKWGTKGNEDGELNYPTAVAIDGSGNVYVADEGNNRIQKFSSTGDFIRKWGTNGIGDGQFSYPSGIAIDKSGNIYVADYNNYRIQKFSSTGKFITNWGSYGTGNGQFINPHQIATDKLGNIYVTDCKGNRIQKFNSIGKFITKYGTKGNGNGQFDTPLGIAVDNLLNVYVSDFGNNHIQKLILIK